MKNTTPPSSKSNHQQSFKPTEETKKVTWISTPQQSSSRVLVEDTPSDHGQEQPEIEDNSNDSYMAELLSDSLNPNQTTTNQSKPILESQYQIQEEDHEPNHSAIILDKSLEFDDTHLIPLGPETQFAQNSLERNGPLTFGSHSHDLLESQELSNLSEGQQDISDSLRPTSLQFLRHSRNHLQSSNQNLTRNTSNFEINQNSTSIMEPDDLFQRDPSISARLDISLEGSQSFNLNHMDQEAIQSTIPPPLNLHQQTSAISQSLETSRLIEDQSLEISRIGTMDIPLHSTCVHDFSSPNPDTSLPIILNTTRNSKTKSPLITPPQSINNNQILTSNHTSPITPHRPVSSPPPLLNSPTPIKDRISDSQQPKTSTPHPNPKPNPSARLLFTNQKNPPVFNQADSDIFDLTGEIILGLPASQSQNTQNNFNESYKSIPESKKISEPIIETSITKEEIILAPSSSQDRSDSQSVDEDKVDQVMRQEIEDLEEFQEANFLLDQDFSIENGMIVAKYPSSKKTNKFDLEKESNGKIQRGTDPNGASPEIDQSILPNLQSPSIPDKHILSKDLQNSSIKIPSETRSDESSFEPAPPTQINEPISVMKPPEKVNKIGQEHQLVSRFENRDQDILKASMDRNPVAGPSNPIASDTARSMRDPQRVEDQRRSSKKKSISQPERSIESENGQQLNKSKTVLPVPSLSSRTIQGKRRLIDSINDVDEAFLFPSSPITNSHLAPNPSLVIPNPIISPVDKLNHKGSNKSNQKKVNEFENGQESDKSIKTLPETRSDESSFEPAPPTQINQSFSSMNPPEKVNKNNQKSKFVDQLDVVGDQDGLKESVDRGLEAGPSNPVGLRTDYQRFGNQRISHRDKSILDFPMESDQGQETDKSVKSLPETRSDESSFEPAPPNRFKDQKKVHKEKSTLQLPSESDTGQETDKYAKTLPETRSDESSFEPAPPTQINEPKSSTKPLDKVITNVRESNLVAQVDSLGRNISQEPVNRAPEAGPSYPSARREPQRFEDKMDLQKEKTIPQPAPSTESADGHQRKKSKTTLPVQSGSSSRITQRKRKLMSLTSDVDEEIPSPSSSTPKSRPVPNPSLATSKSIMTSTSIDARNAGHSDQRKEKNVIGSDNGQEINKSNTTTLPVQSCSSNRMSQGKRKRSRTADVDQGIFSSSLSAPESEHAPVLTVGVNEEIPSSSLSGPESEHPPAVTTKQGKPNLTGTSSVADSNKRRKTNVKVTQTTRTGLVSKLTNRLTKRKAKVSKANNQKKNKGKGKNQEEKGKFPIQRVLAYDHELNGYRGAKLIGIQKEGIQVLDDSGQEKVCQVEELRKYEIRRGDLVKYLGNRFKDIESQRTDIRIVKSVIEVHKIQEDRTDSDPADLVSLSSVIDYHRFCDHELLAEEIVIGIQFKLGELLVLGDESEQLSDRKLNEEVLRELQKLIDQENEKGKKIIKSEPCTPQIKNQPNRNLNRVRERDRRGGSESTKIFGDFGLILTELKSPVEIKKGRNDRKVKVENKIQNNKEEIEIRLKSNGGKVIDGIDEMIEFIKPLPHHQTTQKKRKVRSKSCPWGEDEDEEHGNRKIEIVKKTQEFDQVKTILLLTDGPVKTLKYWLALALGIPCVSNQWVIDSCQEGVCLDWKSYLLASGYSKHLKTFCFGNQRESYQKPEFDLRSIIESFGNRNENENQQIQNENFFHFQYQHQVKLFHDQRFYCLVKKSNKKETWYNNVWWILCCLGVKDIKFKTIEKFKDLEERNGLIEEMNEFDYVLIDDELELQNEEDSLKIKNLVDLDWIKESLVFGKLLPVYRWKLIND